MHMKSRIRKPSNQNSGAIADMAFLLLIFFMVTTSLQRQKSISMSLPPFYDGPAGQMSDSKVLSLLINADDQCMLEGKEIHWQELKEELNKELELTLNNTNKPIINLKIHQESSYDAYMNLISAVKSSIKYIKTDLSKSIFDKSNDKLTALELSQISRMVNIKISESEFNN